MDRAHCQRGGGVYRKHCAVPVRERADFADGVEQTGAGLVVGGVHQRDIRVFPQHSLHRIEIRRSVARQLQIDVRQAVIGTDFYRAGAVGSVVDHQDFFVRRQQRVEHHVDVEGARSTEEHRRVFLWVGMHDFEQILTQPPHQPGEFLFTRADIRHHLRELDRVGGGGGAGVKQNISFDVHIFLLESIYRAIMS